MYKEMVYFGAELLNYWVLIFCGVKLFAKIYDIKISKSICIQNVIFALLCIPIAIMGAWHYYFTIYSNALTYIIVIYMCILIRLLAKRKISFSLVSFYIFGMRLVDLWIVAVVKEVSNVSRTVTLDLIHKGIHRCLFILVLVCIYVFVYNICSKRNIVEYLMENPLYCRLLCIYSFIGIACFSTVYRFDYRKDLISYWTFYLVCAFIIIGTFLYYFIQIKSKEKERLLNMRNDMMEANYQGLQKAYNANRVLQHDNKNHMLAMYELIKENKNEEALNYINKWMSVSQQAFGNLKSGNAIIDIIVNSKLNEAKDKNIQFECELDYLGEIKIEDVDLCALLANLLDNAIEAAEKVKNDPHIYLKINRMNDTLLILIRNSIEKPMVNKKKFFQTEKEDPHLHGWGMKSIERVVHKYDGQIEHTWQEACFETFVNIPV